MSKTVRINDRDYRLELWDTAGQEKYKSLVKGYLKGAHACLFVYDCRGYYFTIQISIRTWVWLTGLL